jgi:hypothetical protein
MVRLYPASYRRLFGEQMLQTFQDHYRDAVASGEESAPRFWLGVITDEAKALPRARLASLGGSLHMISLPSLLQVAGWTMLAAVALCVPFVLSQVPFWSALDYDSLVTDIARIAGNSLMVSLILVVIPLTLVRVTTAFFPSLYGRAPRSGTLRARGWLRAGLLLGVLVGTYGVILNLVATLTASGVNQASFNFVTKFVAPVALSFTFGVVGAVLGYGRGTARASAAAGFAAGLLGGLLSVASLVLVIALYWNGVCTDAYSSVINYDYLRLASPSAPPPGLWQFLWEGELGGAALTASKIALLGGSFAALGGAFGALASGRSQTRPPLAPGATPRRSPERAFILVMGGLGLVVWLVSALFLGGVAAAGALITPPERLLQSQRFSLYALSLASLTAPAFFLWAGVFAIPIVTVIVSARRARALPAIPGTPGWLARTAPTQGRVETLAMTGGRPRLRRYWRVYLLALLLIPALASVYGAETERVYESSATIYVQTNTFLKDFLAQDDNSFATKAQNVSDAIGMLVQTDTFLVSVARDSSLKNQYDLGSSAGQDAVVARIAGTMTVSANTRNIVVVTATDRFSALVAKELAGAVITESVAFYANQELATLNQAQDFYGKQLSDITATVADDATKVNDYQRQHPEVLTATGATDPTYVALKNQLSADQAAQASFQSNVDSVQQAMEAAKTGTSYDIKPLDPPTLPLSPTVKISNVLVYLIGGLVAVLILFALTGISYRSRVALE